ncbi:hypothetical protein OV203_05570 [Nannocystis sp. ILAH1]|uniref:hypothetical protein n=1 Tax=Nannocystis sp. ILAH1 TaxID=2996789 RepID=UPI00226F95E0|nr:hypothetical protein [Nannocystis sp. ILAH1]MCY0986577.1 hypothetical protein [Nannocystis sp. ILAH1]
MSPDAPGRAAFATLAAWYADRREYPDVTRLVAELAGRDAARSGQRLAALIRQAGADRRLGRKRAPIWGGSGDIDALLVHLARELADKASGDPALPVVEALLAEPLVEGEAAALAILRRSPTPAADAILAEIVATPATRSHAALVEAIEQAHARGLASAAIARLVDHPHPGVRASARSACGRVGKAATARPDAATSVRTWTGPALERAATRVWPPRPPGVVWTRVTVDADGAGAATTRTHVGWLLGQDETALRILTWHATVERSRAVRSDGDLTDAIDDCAR